MTCSKSQVIKIILNILFCLICCILSLADSMCCWNYITTGKFCFEYLRISIIVSAIMHPLILIIYHTLSLTMINYISNEDFKGLINKNEAYAMIFFKHIIKNRKYLIFPIALFLTIITYTKIFSFYSLKFLVHQHAGYEIFFNVITQTLYIPMFIQIVFQTFPQIILQTTNDILIIESNPIPDDNFMSNFLTISNIISLLYILNFCIFSCRKKLTIYNNHPVVESLNDVSDSNQYSSLNNNINTISKISNEVYQYSPDFERG